MVNPAVNSALYSLNSLTGIELVKQLILTERPLVNGIPVLLSGEGSGGPTPTPSLENVVFQTGDQNISGIKNFASNPQFDGVNLSTESYSIAMAIALG
jgi:hypothetical protein